MDHKEDLKKLSKMEEADELIKELKAGTPYDKDYCIPDEIDLNELEDYDLDEEDEDDEDWEEDCEDDEQPYYEPTPAECDSSAPKDYDYICPYCGLGMDDDEYVAGAFDKVIIECPRCDNEFRLDIEMEPKYSTSRLDKDKKVVEKW